MKLVEKTITDFAEILASNAPAPGGGSTAALQGVMGAALMGMVASLTIGRKKYAEYEYLMIESTQEAEYLRLRFTDIIDRDTEAFNGVSAALAMPKETDDDKAARREAMQSALKACTLTPFEIMENAMRSIEVIYKMHGKTNETAASDLGVAVLSLKAALQGAWLNVLINLDGIKDETFTAKYREAGETLLKKTLPLADKIYQSILDGLVK